MKPYRDQEVPWLCGRCGEVAEPQARCRRCGQPLCADHRPARWGRCHACEASYERRRGRTLLWLAVAHLTLLASLLAGALIAEDLYGGLPGADLPPWAKLLLVFLLTGPLPLALLPGRRLLFLLARAPAPRGGAKEQR
jgi:hypothetical protein